MTRVPVDPWSQLAYEPEGVVEDVDPNLLWFNSEIRLDDVLEASEHQRHYEYTVDGKKRIKPGSKQTTVGVTTAVNGKTVAIFKFEDKLFAINNVCPHQGGSLHLGDIEDIDGAVCVSCPRHRWPFSLKDGSCLVRETLRAECFRIQIRRDAHGVDMIFIGFQAFSQSLFSADDF